MISIETRGFLHAQATLRGMDVDKKAAKAVQQVTIQLVRFGASITPVATGSMRDAWTAEAHGLIGRVFIDPSAINSRSGVPVSSYAGAVSARYGIAAAMSQESARLGAEALEKIRW